MNKDYPVVLLCGGKGTRLEGDRFSPPKCLIEVKGKPIIWHIMKHYASHGFNNFIICLGHKGDMIKDYFLNFNMKNSDLNIRFEGGYSNVEVIKQNFSIEDWNVKLVETGEDTMTGSRLKKIERYIETDLFLMTYGDGVSNVNLSELLSFHLEHGALATLTGVHPRSQYGQLNMNGNLVTSFREKAILTEQYINGGYFVLHKKVLEDIAEDTLDCVWENEPLERLVYMNELFVYKHEGFWQGMDTLKDRDFLEVLMNNQEGKDISYV